MPVHAAAIPVDADQGGQAERGDTGHAARHWRAFRSGPPSSQGKRGSLPDGVSDAIMADGDGESGSVRYRRHDGPGGQPALRRVWSSPCCRVWRAAALRLPSVDWPWTLDLSLPAGREAVPCPASPLGCVRFGPVAARCKPRFTEGEAPAVRTAPGRFAPAPLPSSGLAPSACARPQETAPEGADAGTTQAEPPGQSKGSRP